MTWSGPVRRSSPPTGYRRLSRQAQMSFCYYSLIACTFDGIAGFDHTPLCCTDPVGGARGRTGVAGRLLSCPPDARLALQAEPRPPPPHPRAEAQGDELARVRREPAPAR